jgi:hypothetical protein
MTESLLSQFINFIDKGVYTRIVGFEPTLIPAISLEGESEIMGKNVDEVKLGDEILNMPVVEGNRFGLTKEGWPNRTLLYLCDSYPSLCSRCARIDCVKRDEKKELV